MLFIKKHIPITIIVIFHLVGFVGFLFNPAYFRALTPVNLLLSAFLIILMSNQTKGMFYLTLLLVGLAGYLVEVLGVKTGFIFGHYYYGSALGYKLLSVPLLIGVNWALLIYGTSQFFNFSNRYANALGSSVLMVFLDFFIEHSASKFDFWYWKNAHIPLQNYIAWFLISFLINVFAAKHLTGKPNLTVKAFYIIQVLFFVALYFFI